MTSNTSGGNSFQRTLLSDLKISDSKKESLII